MFVQYAIVGLVVAVAAGVVVRKLVAPFLKSAGGSCGCGSAAACGAGKDRRGRAASATTSRAATAGGGDVLPRAPFGSEEWLAEIARLEAERATKRDPHAAH